MNLQKTIGLPAEAASEREIIRAINLKLAFLGCPTPSAADDPDGAMIAGLLLRQQETNRLLADYLNPADSRIQNFLHKYLQGTETEIKLPARGGPSPARLGRKAGTASASTSSPMACSD